MIPMHEESCEMGAHDAAFCISITGYSTFMPMSFILIEWLSYVRPKQLVADPNCYTGLKLSDVWPKVANKHLQSNHSQPESKGSRQTNKVLHAI